MSISTVLVANRGEIAVRVVRACRELGLRSVAVHSVEDRDGLAVRLADAAVQIGPPPAKLSYLNIPAVIEAARQAGADAVHPGYGFLSEDADFAEICEAHGLTFIGPPPAAMRKLADKATARALMVAAGLPLLPGSTDPVDTVEDAAALAREIGFPVIIKAAAGGGGRGMQIVTAAAELAAAYRTTRATSQALFGDSRVYLERYLPAARHVEIQVMCDAHGTALDLGERDCSVQRRHQKLIEESPAPGLPEGLARHMGELALRGARSVGYRGAGTFEFLVADGRCYFMEVNCRIQVEHPVTEMVTGLDLVRQQILVAAGEPLGLTQDDVQPRGVSIECRINAEDPDRGFAPAPGTLERFTPAAGPFVRVDTHAVVGSTVSASYDSLLGKLVVWAPDRDQAIARMRRALAEFDVAGPGIRTTIGFLRRVMDDPTFCRAGHSTTFVDRLLAPPPAAA